VAFFAYRYSFKLSFPEMIFLIKSAFFSAYIAAYTGDVKKNLPLPESTDTQMVT
jgi:hypothetical protein